ncbi:hypothetical protein QN239_10410 [Mycolicibacterium sp. Y3]
MIRRRRTQPALPPFPPMYLSTLPTGVDQAFLRARRRNHQPATCTGAFNVATEVCDVCTPLAIEISRLKNPVSMRRDIEDILDAVHELQVTNVSLIAESRTLAEDIRAQSRTAAADLAVRPQLPEIGDTQIVSGTWVSPLVQYVEPYAADLAHLLSVALPPDDQRLKGAPSASDRLVKALRGLDHAVATAERRLVKVAERQQLPTVEEFNSQQEKRVDAERRQRALTKLGAV